jgi:peptide/nickel transport system permease protein
LKIFIVRRLAYIIVVFLATSLFVFWLSRATGDPRLVFLDEYTTKEAWAAWGREMGLEKPLVVQYFIWLGNAVTGDFGQSLAQRTNSLDVITSRIPATLQLTAGAFMFAVIVGVPLGVLSAVSRGSFLDYIGRTFALFGQALPPFWLGIMLILIFSVRLDWLPTSQRGGPDHYILPSITLGWLVASGFLRLVRSSMLEVLDSEYVKLARAKGVGNRSIIWKHAFRNATLAPMTYAGLLLASLLTGTVVTETVFAWPGLGRLAVQSVFNSDFPVLTGVVMLFTLFYVGMNFLVDLTYAYLDPRIRYN